MTYSQAMKLVNELRSMGLESFQNVIDNDNVFIYYQEITSEASRDIYERLRRSPYRNYIHRPLPEGQSVVYIMVMDLADKVNNAYRSLSAREDASEYKFLCYASRDYPGYAYLKIYHRDATKPKTLEQLQALTGYQQTYTFGTVPGMYDELVDQITADDVVRLLKRRYEPILWHRDG